MQVQEMMKILFVNCPWRLRACASIPLPLPLPLPLSLSLSLSLSVSLSLWYIYGTHTHTHTKFLSLSLSLSFSLILIFSLFPLGEQSDRPQALSYLPEPPRIPLRPSFGGGLGRRREIHSHAMLPVPPVVLWIIHNPPM